MLPPPPPPAILISTVVPVTWKVLPAPTKFNVFIGPLVITVLVADVIPIIKPPVLVVTPLTFKNGSAAPVACKKVSPPTL